MSTERVVEMHPAYDCIEVQPCVHGSKHCKPGSGGSHGRCAAIMSWSLRGEAGAVEFTFFTGMFLPATPARVRVGGASGKCLSIHSAFEMRDALNEADGCGLTGGHCWHDVTYLAADDLLEVLVAKGHEALWTELEQWYEVMVDRQTRHALRAWIPPT